MIRQERGNIETLFNGSLRNVARSFRSWTLQFFFFEDKTNASDQYTLCAEECTLRDGKWEMQSLTKPMKLIQTSHRRKPCEPRISREGWRSTIVAAPRKTFTQSRRARCPQKYRPRTMYSNNGEHAHQARGAHAEQSNCSSPSEQPLVFHD